ncbi:MULTISPECIES: ABC transporter permease [Aestuariimicrobium]|uniref:ABC transporter permease n=1 Tax=Aestuariimicrobium TaxID=396388 RepID=UPI0003B67BF2|nr:MULTISPECIES: ABC transporter permease [Aestuariimicrobium]CAI9401105.1 Dipeptide transport system permease protein DppB [Aestuariimicrobium sp. T2.26MG-19.2B]
MRFILRRLGFFVVTLWVALTVNFFVPRLMPGNPAEAMMARYKGRVNPEALKALEVAFGLDTQKPLLVQYVEYLGNTLTGHFGISLTFFPTQVGKVVLQALPWTLGLVGLTTVIAFVVGTLIGTIGGWRRNGIVDSILPPVFVITSALPYFWVGLILILVFSLGTNGALPNDGGYDPILDAGWNGAFIVDVLKHAVLPSVSILLISIGGWILTMRNNVVTTLAEDYITMARAKGIPDRKIMIHYAARNAVLPNLSGFAMSLGFVVSGSILVEYTFNYPGVGYMLLSAVNNQDYPLMQALFVLITVTVLVAVLISDFLTAWLDPRVRTAS